MHPCGRDDLKVEITTICPVTMLSSAVSFNALSTSASSSSRPRRPAEGARQPQIQQRLREEAARAARFEQWGNLGTCNAFPYFVEDFDRQVYLDLVAKQAKRFQVTLFGHC